jgi:hypothetical protein
LGQSSLQLRPGQFSIRIMKESYHFGPLLVTAQM